MNKEEVTRVHNLVTKKYEDFLKEGHECKNLLEKELKRILDFNTGTKIVGQSSISDLNKAIYDLTSNLTHICSELSYSILRQQEFEEKEAKKEENDGNK